MERTGDHCGVGTGAGRRCGTTPRSGSALDRPTYRGPTGRAPRHLPFRAPPCRSCAGRPSAACSPRATSQPREPLAWRGSTSNCCATDRGGRAVGRAGASRPRRDGTVGWRSSPRSRRRRFEYYAAHDGSIVAAYVEHRGLAELESMPERFFLNVVLLRVYCPCARRRARAGARAGWPRSDRCSATPARREPSVFLLAAPCPPGSLSPGQRHRHLSGRQHRFGRALDYGVDRAAPETSTSGPADELRQPGLCALIREGSPCAWPLRARDVWTAESACRGSSACSAPPRRLGLGGRAPNSGDAAATPRPRRRSPRTDGPATRRPGSARGRSGAWCRREEHDQARRPRCNARRV